MSNLYNEVLVGNVANVKDEKLALSIVKYFEYKKILANNYNKAREILGEEYRDYRYCKNRYFNTIRRLFEKKSAELLADNKFEGFVFRAKIMYNSPIIRPDGSFFVIEKIHNKVNPDDFKLTDGKKYITPKNNLQKMLLEYGKKLIEGNEFSKLELNKSIIQDFSPSEDDENYLSYRFIIEEMTTSSRR